MNKVQQVNELHSKAMEMANLAFIARVQGEPDKVRQFSKTAFDYERQAALLLLTDYEIEPTRSVLFRSAATLALNGENYREAERMIAFGLSGQPPVAILEELRELLYQLPLPPRSQSFKLSPVSYEPMATVG
ncbi:MAG: hypothetical protein BWK78_08225 [Thiotrichaceae bacterium IS1]|nr:MAG: hypothetical protein BWK78_08225 [Thiotrichaceae bacterium IS1]